MITIVEDNMTRDTRHTILIFENIVLAEDSSLYPTVRERLKSEIANHSLELHGDETRLEIHSCPDIPRYSTTEYGNFSKRIEYSKCPATDYRSITVSYNICRQCVDWLDLKDQLQGTRCAMVSLKAVLH